MRVRRTGGPAQGRSRRSNPPRRRIPTPPRDGRCVVSPTYDLARTARRATENCFPRHKWSDISSLSSDHYLYAFFRELLDTRVFATKERRPLITPELQVRLWPYLGGIARESRMKALIVGGVEDHMHILLSIPATLSIATTVQLLKGNSSKWIHDTFKEHGNFEWQEGYGAFSIDVSGVEETLKYIEGQREHHRTLTFREELEIFLKKHGMEYVDRDLD